MNKVSNRQISSDRMEAIARGVMARHEEGHAYLKRVTDDTINAARALHVSDPEIEKWAAHRLTRLARDAEGLREIKSLLNKLYGHSLSIK